MLREIRQWVCSIAIVSFVRFRFASRSTIRSRRDGSDTKQYTLNREHLKSLHL
jgi:hypothetical protein